MRVLSFQDRKQRFVFYFWMFTQTLFKILMVLGTNTGPQNDWSVSHKASRSARRESTTESSEVQKRLLSLLIKSWPTDGARESAFPL